MDITKQEKELLDLLRGVQPNDDCSEFRVEIENDGDGVWNIKCKSWSHTIHGIGASFGEAWDRLSSAPIES